MIFDSNGPLKLLKRTPKERRLEIAIELAGIGGEMEIQALKAMFEGQRLLFFKFKIDDQLVAAEALGKARQTNIREYLEKSIRFEVSSFKDGPYYSVQGDETSEEPHYYTYTEVSFPNLYGELKKALEEKWIQPSGMKAYKGSGQKHYELRTGNDNLREKIVTVINSAIKEAGGEEQLSKERKSKRV